MAAGGDSIQASVASGSQEEEAGPSQLPDTSGDALLAQQLAAEMERGSYAKVNLTYSSMFMHPLSIKGPSSPSVLARLLAEQAEI